LPSLGQGRTARLERKIIKANYSNLIQINHTYFPRLQSKFRYNKHLVFSSYEVKKIPHLSKIPLTILIKSTNCLKFEQNMPTSRVCREARVQFLLHQFTAFTFCGPFLGDEMCIMVHAASAARNHVRTHYSRAIAIKSDGYLSMDIVISGARN
jgi:hypothetical protein